MSTPVERPTEKSARSPARSFRVDVAGVSLSHPDRVLFPDVGVTKLGLARYYESIADWIVPHVIDRPLTLVRCPNGLGARSTAEQPACFYMKHSKVWAPPALRRVRIPELRKIGEYLIADSVAAVVGLVQMDVLEIHTWNSRFARIERPDRIVIDLDPGDGVAWADVVTAAKTVRALFEALDLACFAKTTGGRGLHIVVPITPRADWTECLAFARGCALALVRAHPDTFTERFARRGRERKILVDYLRNNRTNTSIAAYSTRARTGAPISVPIAWSELTATTTPDRFTIVTVPRRLSKLRRDPWKAYAATRQTIPRGAVRALASL
jgi:bifunctional non-homologous end joining protein LigD